MRSKTLAQLAALVVAGIAITGCGTSRDDVEVIARGDPGSAPEPSEASPTTVQPTPERSTVARERFAEPEVAGLELLTTTPARAEPEPEPEPEPPADSPTEPTIEDVPVEPEAASSSPPPSPAPSQPLPRRAPPEAEEDPSTFILEAGRTYCTWRVYTRREFFCTDLEPAAAQERCSEHQTERFGQPIACVCTQAEGYAPQCEAPASSS